MPIYIAKPNTWFKEGTIAELIESIYTMNGKEFGFFRGTYIVGSSKLISHDKGLYNSGHKDGDEIQVSSLCAFEEFEIKTVENT